MKIFQYKKKNDMKCIAVIVSAGIGKRFGSSDKVFAEIFDKPLLIWAVQAFEDINLIDEIWIVTRKELFQRARENLEKFNIKKVKKIIEGGGQRQDSVYNALKELYENTDIVLIHDAARPMVSKTLIKKILNAMNSEIDGVIPVVPLNDTIKWIKKENIVGGTLNRDILRAVQTPQAFWFKKLLQAYKKAYEEDFYGTDDASLIERYGGKVLTIDGEEKNIKITTKQDLQKLSVLAGMNNFSNHESYREQKNNISLKSIRIGMGYDSHRFMEGRKLIIGGVEIPYSHGLYGHSDADVLIHAIIDAILGSAGVGDIGTHFPDTDPLYKDISSMELLKKTLNLVKNYGVEPVWIDCTIFAEKPKMLTYIPDMNKNLQKLGLNVNIKAKTNEGMGFIGRCEGISAQAVCLSIKFNL